MFLKSRISSQTWGCDVLGFKKPCGKSLTPGAWSKPYKREPQTANLTARSWSRDFLTFAVLGKCWKTSIFLFLSIVLNISFVTDARYKTPNLGPSTWLSRARYFPFCLLRLLFSPFPAIMHTKHEKAKQLTGKQHFIYSLLRHTVPDRSLTRSFPVLQK